MGTTIQLKTNGKLKKTAVGDSEIITTIFDLGPGLKALFERIDPEERVDINTVWQDVKVIVINNIPPEGMEEAPAYVKLEFQRASDSWTDDPQSPIGRSPVGRPK
jgi:hypothetical protein